MPFIDFLNSYIDDNGDDAIASLQGCLRIPSVKDDETVGPGAPFGKACADALTYTLDMCAAAGMKTVNLDGYVGYAEFGPEDATEHVALLGHLDVVPPGDGWTDGPWDAVVHDGRVWSRGTQDDKGPTFAGVHGAIALFKSGADLRHRVRLIFGCDEESSWQCMEHYFGAAGQPMPKLAFTPDAGFPLYHAEKGSYTAIVTRPLGTSTDVIIGFTSGLRPNMVPDKAIVTSADESLIQRLQATLPDGDLTNNGGFQVTGVSAHGGAPHGGVNAAMLLAQGIADVTGDQAWSALVDLCDCDGKGAGIEGRDDLTGPLTLNVGVVNIVNGRLEVVINVRYPATWDESVLQRSWDNLADRGWTLHHFDHTAPLHVPVDQEPVKTLLSVYREHTGDMSAPKTMGGRTYATSVQPVGVAFGAAMAGDPEVAHRPDENISIERYLQCIRIYGDALYRLANVES
ncbi:MAG: Sapep family Mn(2+)-dependent dipeptidase [Armatimonadota bacterium]